MVEGNDDWVVACAALVDAFQPARSVVAVNEQPEEVTLDVTQRHGRRETSYPWTGLVESCGEPDAVELAAAGVGQVLGMKCAHPRLTAHGPAAQHRNRVIGI